MNKYGKVILALVLMIIVNFNVYVYADDIYTFVTNINVAWASTNYTQLLQLINNRLAQNTNDILALGAKQWYYFECDFNISNAQKSANAMLNSVNQTGRYDVMPVAENVTKLILDIPTSVTGAYTQTQIELKHNRGGQDFFIGTIEPLFIVRQLEKPATNYPALIIDSTPTNVYINLSEEDRFGRGSTNAPFARVYFQNRQVTVIAPPSFGTNTFVKWSSDGTNTLGTSTNITFTMTTNNIKAIAVFGAD